MAPAVDITALRAGDRSALARAITLVESTRPDHRAQAREVIDAVVPDAGQALRLGVSGPPGAGKSTLIEALGLHAIEHGRKVAVLAIDPSSSRSGGSILGDKTRMAELGRHPDAFIRPSPSAGTLGGVARRTREAMLLCEAAGFDLVAIETVGVGQSEIAVADLADLLLLVAAPAAGDELQGIKRGIMEMADIIVVNKADGDLVGPAQRAAGDLRHVAHLLRPKWPGWQLEVLLASAVTGEGVAEVWQAVLRTHDALTATGELDRLRARQNLAWMWSEITADLLDALRGHPDVRAALAAVEADVASGKMSPTSAAAELLARFGVPGSGDD